METLPIPVTEVKSYHRKKHNETKQEIIDNLPGKRVDHVLEDKNCPDCHHEMHDIGSSVKKEVIFKPAVLERLDHYQHAYRCNYCSDHNYSDKIIKAPMPKTPLDSALGSASLIAHTIHDKFKLKLPAYRQESELKRLGLPISRQTMTNWHIKVCDYYLGKIYDLLHQELLEEKVIHADETPYQVLESETAKTYYWTFLSGRYSDKKITTYHHGSRKGIEAVNFLQDFDGFVHCDQYGGYFQLKDVTLVGCWAHARRKFYEAQPQEYDDTSISQKALAYINQIFHLDSQWAELTSEERYENRKKQLKPLIEKFINWCHKKQRNVLRNSKLGKAFSYFLSHEDKFRNVLRNGDLVLTNNMAERSIKELVMGRNNWIFSQSFKGAQSVAIILSIIKIGERNDLDPLKYIQYLLEKLPNETDINNQETLKAYLPWAEEVQAACK